MRHRAFQIGLRSFGPGVALAVGVQIVLVCFLAFKNPTRPMASGSATVLFVPDQPLSGVPARLVQAIRVDAVSSGTSVLYSGFVEVDVDVYPVGSTELPPRAEGYAEDNLVALHGVFRSLAKSPMPATTDARFFRAVGWPFACLRGSVSGAGRIGSDWHADRGILLSRSEVSDRGVPSWRELIPTDPYVPGLIGNIAVIGLPIGLLLMLFRHTRTPKNAGRCSSCGYLLQGLPPGMRCPECGMASAQAS